MCNHDSLSDWNSKHWHTGFSGYQLSPNVLAANNTTNRSKIQHTHILQIIGNWDPCCPWMQLPKLSPYSQYNSVCTTNRFPALSASWPPLTQQLYCCSTTSPLSPNQPCLGVWSPKQTIPSFSNSYKIWSATAPLPQTLWPFILHQLIQSESTWQNTPTSKWSMHLPCTKIM